MQLAMASHVGGGVSSRIGASRINGLRLETLRQQTALGTKRKPGPLGAGFLVGASYPVAAAPG